MFRCRIAAANTDKLQYKFKFYSYVMWNCVDDKNDNEEGRAPLEYLPRGPRVSSYATAYSYKFDKCFFLNYSELVAFCCYLH